MTQPFISSIGTYFTSQLFYERQVLMHSEKKVGKPVFTLHKDIPGLINFGKRYVALEDPTGYKVTQELLNGDFIHWGYLMRSSWFIAAKEKWDEELDAKLTSKGLDAIQGIAKEEEASPAIRLQAAKFLATKGYQPKTTKKRGRPTSLEVESELKHATELQTTINEDLARIGKGAIN